MIWLFLARSTSHPVAAQSDCTNIPLAAGGAQEDGTILNSGFWAMVFGGSSTWIRQDSRSWKIKKFGQRSHQTAFIMAPSMTTPAATYFQSATSNFRASATMAAFLRRPPLRTTRSLNHRASADCG
jgi:hypothetical protein